MCYKCNKSICENCSNFDVYMQIYTGGKIRVCHVCLMNIENKSGKGNNGFEISGPTAIKKVISVGFNE